MQNKMITEPKKGCIASIALYREMIEKGYGIYDILSQFIKFVVYEKKVNEFTAGNINQYLKETFNYSVPEASVKEAIKRIDSIKQIGDSYQLASDITYDDGFLQNKRRLENEADNIFNDIIGFIEKNRKKQLTNREREKVFYELYDFLLKNDLKNKDYTKLISLWVLQNANNSHIQSILNEIREGVFLTSAFEYTPNEYKEKLWDTPLTLYYDVEDLFSLEGLNGEPYTSLSNDLYKLIQECNNKGKKQLISLMYFSSIKQEVESFYNAAFEILQGGKRTFQVKPAMANILSGCEYSSDAQERKVRFFQRLSYKGFKEFDVTVYEEKDYQYNIIDTETLEKLKQDFPRYDEESLLRIQSILNKINYLRKNNSSSFYKCGHFFVTETGSMLNVALHSDILRPDAVPLATNVEFLTERLWSKINSSFGSNKPKSVNAVVMAQLILSSQTHIVIKEKYEELQKRYKEEQISEDEANEILVTLKEARHLSQQISVENAEKIFEFIDSSIDEEIASRNEIKEKLQEAEKKISKIEQEKKDIVQQNERSNLQHFEETEDEKKFHSKRQRLQRIFIPLIVLFTGMLIITGFINRFISNDFARLIFDILNSIGIAGAISSASIMVVKLRVLEKNRSKDW